MPNELDLEAAAKEAAGSRDRRPRRVKIRKNSLTGNFYLDRQSRWVPWKHAAWFSSERAAERFAQQHGVEVFGLFPCESCFGKP